MATKKTKVNTVIVGGGHAGVNMACVIALEQKNRSYIVLEKAQGLFGKWKFNRWDAFKMNTPRKFNRLYGQKDDLKDDAMGRPIADDVALWDKHVEDLKLCYRVGCEVTR
jgi:cation diffusion facilitator CzcD-associated flavoprotein CzcO